MDFSLGVVFEYNIKKGAVCQKGRFSDIFNLRDFQIYLICVILCKIL